MLFLGGCRRVHCGNGCDAGLRYRTASYAFFFSLITPPLGLDVHRKTSSRAHPPRSSFPTLIARMSSMAPCTSRPVSHLPDPPPRNRPSIPLPNHPSHQPTYPSPCRMRYRQSTRRPAGCAPPPPPPPRRARPALAHETRGEASRRAPCISAACRCRTIPAAACQSSRGPEWM